MVNSTKWFAALLGLLLLGAGSISKAESKPKPQTVPAWLVGTYVSLPGETKDVFVRRVAEALKTWADTTHTEACGPIAHRQDGGYIVVLTTQKSQIMCMISTSAPAGATLIGESIHDHPTATDKSGVLLNQDDHNALAAVGDTRMANCSAHHRHCWVNAEPASFSADDYAGGPGYLVSMGRLLYQHGEGTAKVINPHL